MRTSAPQEAQRKVVDCSIFVISTLLSFQKNGQATTGPPGGVNRDEKSGKAPTPAHNLLFIQTPIQFCKSFVDKLNHVSRVKGC